MGRNYAGILGLLAFVTVVARGVLHASSASSTIPLAAALMFVFAALGFVLGSIAESAVTDALKARFTAEMQRLASDSTADVAK